MGHFCPPGSGSGSAIWMRIRIQQLKLMRIRIRNPDLNWILPVFCMRIRITQFYLGGGGVCIKIHKIHATFPTFFEKCFLLLFRSALSLLVFCPAVPLSNGLINWERGGPIPPWALFIHSSGQKARVNPSKLFQTRPNGLYSGWKNLGRPYGTLILKVQKLERFFYNSIYLVPRMKN